MSSTSISEILAAKRDVEADPIYRALNHDPLDSDVSEPELSRDPEATPRAAFVQPLERQDWRQQAECQYYNPETFFSEGDRRLVLVAKRICDGCVVKGDCQDWVKKTGENNGVWAAQSPRERQRQFRIDRAALSSTDEHRRTL